MPKVCPSWLLRSKKRLRTAQIPRKKSGGAGGAESKCRILDVLPGDEQLFFRYCHIVGWPVKSGVLNRAIGVKNYPRIPNMDGEPQTMILMFMYPLYLFPLYIYIYYIYIWLVVWNIFPQQQNALGSSAIVKVSEQTGAAPKPIPPRFPGSK